MILKSGLFPMVPTIKNTLLNFFEKSVDIFIFYMVPYNQVKKQTT